MGKSVLISIQPKWCELIAAGKKTIEVRKTKPQLETPFKVYIYCTNTRPFLVWGDVFRGDWETEFTAISGYSRKEAERIWDVFNGNVIGEFVCDEILDYDVAEVSTDVGIFYYYERFLENSLNDCLTDGELLDYGDFKPLYGWHISHLNIYDTPKALNHFSTVDKVAVNKCEYRERVYNNPDLTNAAWLPGGYICNKGETDWCSQCKTKPMVRPPQSWCYIENVK